MRWTVLLLSSCLGAPGMACGIVSGAISDFTDHATIQGPGSIAYGVSVPQSAVDSAGGGYRGTLTNLEPGVDAQAALYRFLVRPSPDDLPGDGEPMGERFLPGAGDHTFAVPIEGWEYWVQIGDSEYGDPQIDEWFVIEVRGESIVEVELDASLVLDKEGSNAPDEDAVTWERVW
jgi:hypothetical protein